MIRTLILAIVVLATGACNSFAEMRTASSKGIANTYSCAQINSAFSAYEADKTSFGALKQIAIMSGVQIPDNPNIDVSAYYENIKNAANIALIMQGCPPRQ